MNDHDLKNLLDQAGDSQPDPKAKQQAIRMALDAFETAHASEKVGEEKISEINSQGFIHWLRHTFSSNKMNRRDDVNRESVFQQKWLLGGVATTCVVLFGVMITTYNPGIMTKDPYVETYPLNLPNPSASDKDDTAVLEEMEITTEYRTISADTKKLDKSDVGALPDMEIAEALQRAKGTAIQTQTAAKPMADMALSSPAVAPMAMRQELKSAAEKVIQQTHQETGRDHFESFETNPIKLTRSSPAVAPMAMRQELKSAPEKILQQTHQETGRDRFESFETNPIKLTSEEPVSTFSIDVDTASYSFTRKQLNSGVLPQKDAVRLEEMVNYFDYQYPQASSKSEPFSRSVTVMDSPWHKDKKLIHIGIKGYEITEQPKSNIVFLLDVSGSMNAPDKLPLVKQSMNLLLSKLRPDDTVSIAVYAGAAGTILEPTAVSEKQKIISAINQLSAGGSTAGAQGIKLAYQLAESSFKKDAVNRIFLATDGDFNVGITNNEELKGFVERKREKGIYLSILGFGGGNYNDALMQDLAQNGNGVAAYIDTLSEAQKVLVHEATSSLFPIAKDVKIQLEFNPTTVAEYRLLGYETRALKREDFNNDAVDAGEIGAGHSVTAIYEITPAGSAAQLIDNSRYAKKEKLEAASNEYAFLKIRYKLPKEDTSKLLTTVIDKETESSKLLQREARFASAVAGFAQLLKDAKYTGNWGYEDAIALALANKGDDEFGYRSEFVQLVRKAQVAAGM